jgi:hypothetical protein
MKSFKGITVTVLALAVVLSWSVSHAGGQSYSNDQEDPNKKILKQGILGAGVGAISASASGGKAGTGALVGAGTNVIGGALLDTLTAPAPRQQQQQPVYVQQAPQYVQQQPQYVQSSYPVQQQVVRQEAPVQYVQQPVYYQQQAPPQENPNTKILKQGLLGAGVGAISASASGGKAGKGALIGAGTNVIGGALLDTVFSGGGQQQQQQQPVYYQQQPQYVQQQQYANQGYNQGGYATQNGQAPKKKIIRKYDADGNVVSEEEVWE